ncbi:hypothetical protein WJX74_010747 [Apatococcus lobatus]|uniref:Dof-type domain-containing protein n=1 Tax=Apatococcus lobatus TaxID=904363 RepID=A0AAW1SF68_9CHLO
MQQYKRYFKLSNREGCFAVVYMGESAEAAPEPLLATPPRAAPQAEDVGTGRTNDQARSNESSQGEQETRGGGPVDSSGEGRVAKPRPPLPRPEGTVNCPRCTSVDTKFCYYNNYNVKQPRYFCKACQRYWTEGGMLRNVPVGAGRRKNKPIQTRSQDTANPGMQPGENQGPTATSTYQGPGHAHSDYPPTALCTLHASSSASQPHENHGGVPAGTMSAMTGTSALHGAHLLRYQQAQDPSGYHRCFQDPQGQHAAPGHCPSCSQYMHGANGDDSSRRVRPRLDDSLPAPLPHHAAQGQQPGSHPSYPQLLPHGKLPGSPPRDHIPAQQPGSLHPAPSGLLPGTTGTPPHGMHPHAAAAAAAVAAASIPASQPPIYPGIPTAGTPYSHDPTPSQSAQSLAGTLASYPGVYRAQGAASGLGMGMGVGGLAAQVPQANMGYPGMGALGMPGGAGMQQAAGMAQGGWMSLAAVAGQHQEAVQRAAQAQQQLAAAQQQLQRVANFQAHQQLMQSSASHQAQLQAAASGWPPAGAAQQPPAAGSYPGMSNMSWPYNPLYGNGLQWPGFSGQNTGWEGARMEEAFGAQPHTQEEAASLEAAAAATMQNAQHAMHSAAVNGAAAAAAAAGAGEMIQNGHGMQGQGLPHNMMAMGSLHTQHSGLQGTHGNPYQLPGNPLLPPGHGQPMNAHYQNTGMQPHWPGYSLGAGGLSSSHHLMHAPPSRDTHGDGDQCTC